MENEWEKFGPPVAPVPTAFDEWARNGGRTPSPPALAIASPSDEWAKYGPPVQKDEPPKTWGEYAKGVGRSAEQGLTFGLGDEVNATARHYIMGEDYDQALADERAKLAQFRHTNPVSAYGTEIASGMILPMGAAGSALKAGSTLGTAVKAGALTGAGQGALYGYGSGEGGVAPRVVNAAESAAIGGAVGAALPAASAALGAGGRALKDAAGMIFSPAATAERTAGEDIAHIIQQSGLSPTEIAANMRQGRTGSAVPFNVIDAATQAARESGRIGSEVGLLNTARNAAGTGGPAEEAARVALETRLANQPSRLHDMFSTVTGGRSLESEMTRLDHEINTRASSQYQQAYANARDFDIIPEVARFVHGNDEILRTNSSLGNSARAAIRLFMERPDPVTGAIRPINSVPEYLAVRRSLDDMIAKSYSATGRATPETRMLMDLRSSMNAPSGPVMSRNPQLAQADAIFSGARRAQDVIAIGASAVLKPGEAQREALAQFARMTPPQQQAFRIGVMQKFDDMVAGQRFESTMPAKQFNTEATERFIRRVFPQAQADRLWSEIQRENIGTHTFEGVFSGSRTAPMTYQTERMAQIPKIAGKLATLDIPGAIRGLGDLATANYTAQKSQELVRQLTSINPAVAQQAAQRIAQMPAQQAAQEARARLIRSALIGAGPKIATEPRSSNRDRRFMVNALRGAR